MSRSIISILLALGLSGCQGEPEGGAVTYAPHVASAASASIAGDLQRQISAQTKAPDVAGAADILHRQRELFVVLVETTSG